MPTGGGVKLLKRCGYPTKTEAGAAAEHAVKLLGLATDQTTRKRIGDMIAMAKRPLERLNGSHVAEVFTRIERLNSELAAKQAG